MVIISFRIVGGIPYRLCPKKKNSVSPFPIEFYYNDPHSGTDEMTWKTEIFFPLANENKSKKQLTMIKKPNLSFWQIWNMNVGFFGIQFSFGLQQSAVNPIFEFLGAHHNELPLLNLAGPVTGLLIQPIIGAISDRTWLPKWGGRRKPFFLIGAILASICLFAFPLSPKLWFAVGLLWILDAANNTAMEPYRAFVGDKLPNEQLTFGYKCKFICWCWNYYCKLFVIYFQNWLSSCSESTTLCSIESVNLPWMSILYFLLVHNSYCNVVCLENTRNSSI